jgi:hypothetical protein
MNVRPSCLSVTPLSAGESAGCLNVDWKLSVNRGKSNNDTSIQASEEPAGYQLFFVCLSKETTDGSQFVFTSCPEVKMWQQHKVAKAVIQLKVTLGHFFYV